MPRLPSASKEYINSEFARRLETGDPPMIDVLIETEPGRAKEIADDLRQRQGIDIGSAGVISDRFVPANVPDADIADIARIDGIVLIHQDQPTGVLEQAPPTRDLPLLTDVQDPIRQAASDWLFEAVKPEAPYLQSVRISEVEVPRFNFSQVDPFQLAFSASDELGGTQFTGEELTPTSEAVEWIRDSDLTDRAIRQDTKVSVIDTGHTPTEPENGGRMPHLESWVPSEPPMDLMGHGSWCTNMVTGNRAPGAWGSTEGVAPGSKYGHFKALNTLPGFGKTSWILKAMERSLTWGADVISMSLGGEQQGPVGEDPYSRFITDNCKENAGDEDGAIFVVAAGNSGPDKWTIGSPGIAPKALTVGSWSLTDEAPAVFSSRGPQGSWYEDNQERFESDVGDFGGDEVVKPDVAAPGGGRKSAELANHTDELLFQTSTGWYDGLRDGLKDGRANMKGTSMATPAVAGLVKRLYDAGIVRTAREVKRVVRERATAGNHPEAAPGASERNRGKNIAAGYGPMRESLFEP
jgi:subtilisin family serine protease